MPFPLTEADSKRWLFCQNMTKETIPAYACMMLSGDSGNYPALGNTMNNDGTTVWPVYKPNTNAAGAQNPAGFVFNDGAVIPPGGYSRCTMDFPTQALYNIKNKVSPAFGRVGPVANQWYLDGTGEAFQFISTDAANPLANAKNAQYLSTCWVTNTQTTIPVYGGMVQQSPLKKSFPVPAGGDLSQYCNGTGWWFVNPFYYQGYTLHTKPDVLPGLGSAANSANGVQIVGPLGDTNDGNPTTRLQFGYSGIYEINFSAMIWSTTAPNGSLLTIELFLNGQPTTLIGQRRQVNTYDAYNNLVQNTSENLAFSGLLGVGAGQQLNIVNMSSDSILFTTLICYAHRVCRPVAGNPLAGVPLGSTSG